MRVEERGAEWRIDAGDGMREASVLEVEPGVYSDSAGWPKSFEVRTAELDVELSKIRASLAKRGEAGRARRTANRRGADAGQGRPRVGERTAMRCERGQGLVVIEAMKMQNELKSPKTGTCRVAARRRGRQLWRAGEVLATVE